MCLEWAATGGVAELLRRAGWGGGEAWRRMAGAPAGCEALRLLLEASWQGEGEGEGGALGLRRWCVSLVEEMDCSEAAGALLLQAAAAAVVAAELEAQAKTAGARKARAAAARKVRRDSPSSVARSILRSACSSVIPVSGAQTRVLTFSPCA